MPFQPPEGLTAEDEFRHPLRKDAPDNVFFGDSLWVSVVDPESGIHGVNHFHLTNKGFARYEALYLIDGVLQQYGNKFPLPVEADNGPWTDGRLKYEVVDPFNHIRISLDWENFSFDLDFKGRFAPFNYANSSPSGDPMSVFDEYYGGHFEQAMDCTGTFEIHGGRAKGQTRQIDCWSHRDHTWTSRFNERNQWYVREGHFPAHYWPSIQLPDRHINVLGMHWQNDQPIGERANGGFVSDKDGSRPILNAKGEIFPNDGTSSVRQANSFRYELTMPDGEVIHVRSTKHHGTSSSGCAPRTISRTAWTATKPSATSKSKRPERSERARPSTTSCRPFRSGWCERFSSADLLAAPNEWRLVMTDDPGAQGSRRAPSFSPGSWITRTDPS